MKNIFELSPIIKRFALSAILSTLTVLIPTVLNGMEGMEGMEGMGAPVKKISHHEYALAINKAQIEAKKEIKKLKKQYREENSSMEGTKNLINLKNDVEKIYKSVLGNIYGQDFSALKNKITECTDNLINGEWYQCPLSRGKNPTVRKYFGDAVISMLTKTAKEKANDKNQNLILGSFGSGKMLVDFLIAHEMLSNNQNLTMTLAYEDDNVFTAVAQELCKKILQKKFGEDKINTDYLSYKILTSGVDVLTALDLPQDSSLWELNFVFHAENALNKNPKTRILLVTGFDSSKVIVMTVIAPSNKILADTLLLKGFCKKNYSPQKLNGVTLLNDVYSTTISHEKFPQLLEDTGFLTKQ